MKKLLKVSQILIMLLLLGLVSNMEIMGQQFLYSIAMNPQGSCRQGGIVSNPIQYNIIQNGYLVEPNDWIRGKIVEENCQLVAYIEKPISGARFICDARIILWRSPSTGGLITVYDQNHDNQSCNVTSIRIPIPASDAPQTIGETMRYLIWYENRGISCSSGNPCAIADCRLGTASSRYVLNQWEITKNTLLSPTNLSCSTTTSQLSFSFSGVANAVSYTAELSDNNFNSILATKIISSTSNSGDFSNLSENTNYCVRVRANYCNGEVAYSSSSCCTTASTPCNPPTSPSSSNVTSTSATVSWTSATGATGYKVEYKAVNSSSWNSGTTTGTSYPLTGLAICTEYEYRVRTDCSSNSSGFVSGANFTTSGSAVNISGTITDSKNGQAIANAKVSFNGVDVYTNSSGFYSLVTTACSLGSVSISANCYETKQIALNNYGNNPISTSLTPKRIPISGTTNATSILIGNLRTDNYPHEAVVNIVGGTYTVTVNATSSVSLAFSGFCLNPTTKNHYAICSPISENISLTQKYYTISGNAGNIPNVTISTTSGNVTTSNAFGNYSVTELCGASVTVSAYHQCYSFSNNNQQVSNLSDNVFVNFTGTLNSQTISGSVSPADAVVTSTVGTVARSGAFYTISDVPCGTASVGIAVSRTCYEPQTATISNVVSNVTRNFTLVQKTYSISGTISSALDALITVTGTTTAPTGTLNRTTTANIATGNYQLDNIPCGCNPTITPMKAGYLFSPVSRDATNLISNLTAEDFTWMLDCNHPLNITNVIAGVPFDATCDLIKRNIIIRPQNMANNRANAIQRHEVAAILFKALFSGNDNATTITDDWKVLFADLQENPTDTAERKKLRKWAKFLAYLEYNDAPTAFDHSFYAFRGNDFITRANFTKALFEALNIKAAPNSALSLPNPFTDMLITDVQYLYAFRAKELGITTQTTFRPNENITREEAFIMLWRCVNNFSGQTPMPNVAEFTDKDNFFEPNSIVEKNSNINGEGNGIFNYSLGGLAVSHHGLPFGVGVSYSSAQVELAKELFPNELEIFGRGWSHNYQAYILEFNDLFVGDMATDNRLVLMSGASASVYKDLANPVAQDMDNKSKLRKIDANTYVLTAKNQDKYTFQRLANTGISRAPYLLVSIENRNSAASGKRITLEYEPALNPDNKPYQVLRLKTVKAIGINSPAPAYLYTYKAGTNFVQRVDEQNLKNRLISFGYAGNNLQTFINADTKPSYFQYGNNNSANANKNLKNGENMLAQVKLPNGNSINNKYKDKKLLAQETLSSTGGTGYSTIKITNQAQGNVSEITVDDGNGATRTTTTTRDGNGNETENRNAIQNVRREFTDVNNPSLPTKIIQENITTEMRYDINGNMIYRKITGTIGTVTRNTEEFFEYNATNDLTKYTDADGYFVIYERDALGNLMAVKPQGTTTGSVTIERNSWGGITKTTDAEGRWSGVAYDRFGGASKTFNALTEVNNGIDAAGILTGSFTTQNGVTKAVKYQVDNLDRVTKKTLTGTGVSPADEVDLLMKFDDNGNLIEIENELGQRTIMTYDRHLDILREVSFGGYTRKWDFNNNGTLDFMTRCDGKRIKQEYDANLLPTKTYYDANQNNVFDTGDNLLSELRYDDVTRPTLLTSAKNGEYGRLNFFYDELNRLTRVYDVRLGKEIYRYEFTNGGRLKKTFYNDGALVVENIYDFWGRLKSITASINGQNHRMSYVYYANNQLKRVNYPNGISTELLYDEARRLKSFWTKRNVDSKIVLGYGFDYDKWNNPTLLKSTEPYEDVVIPASMLGVTTYTHENNRIATRTLPNGVVQAYVYNANGELISIGGTAHEYTWNETGNLRSYKKDNVTMLGYQTDAMGKRRVAARKETPTSTAEITYEVRDLSGQLLYELDENQNVKNYYVSGLNGLSLRIKSNGDYRTYHANLQGSILAMCKPDGSVSHQYDYKNDAYGTVSQKYEEDKNRFCYVGAFGVMQENDDLLFMQARYVSLNDGRFLSEDPIWHANLYPYADNNPVKNIDPKGTYAVYAHYMSTFVAASFAGYSISEADEIAHYASTYADNPSDGILLANQAIVAIGGGTVGGVIASRLSRRDNIDYSPLSNSQSPTDTKMQQLHCMRSDSENIDNSGAVTRALTGIGIDKTSDKKKLGLNSHTIQDCFAHKGMSYGEHLDFKTHPISATLAVLNDTFPVTMGFLVSTITTYWYLKATK